MLNEELFLMNSVSIPQLLIYLLFRFIPPKSLRLFGPRMTKAVVARTRGAAGCWAAPPLFSRGNGYPIKHPYPLPSLRPFVPD